MRYRIETVPNPEMRTIHVEEMLFSGWFGPRYKFSDYEKLSEGDKAFVDALVSIPGVVKVYLSPYQCSVEKGGVFDWDEIIPPILRVFEGRYGELEDVSVSAIDARYGM